MSRRTVFEFVILTTICVVAGVAAPVHYGHRTDYFAFLVLLFAGVPLFGLAWRIPSPAITWIALAMLLSTPAVWVGTDLFEEFVETSISGVVTSISGTEWDDLSYWSQFRLRHSAVHLLNGYLLAMASLVTFVGSAWLITLLRRRRWFWAGIAHFGIVVGTLTAFATSFVIVAFPE